MVNATFSDDMKKMLAELKGKELLSYECEKNLVQGRAYGKIRLNLADMALDISNEEQIFPFFDTEEEMSCFSCSKENSSVPFQPAVVTETASYPVQKKILAVELITDDILVKSENYHVIFDMALLFHFPEGSLMLARDAWFSEVITIRENDKNYDALYSIQQVKDSWSNDGDYNVEVSRKSKLL